MYFYVNLATKNINIFRFAIYSLTNLCEKICYWIVQLSEEVYAKHKKCRFLSLLLRKPQSYAIMGKRTT